jgi:PPOX class probable F420-dependent enzyme
MSDFEPAHLDTSSENGSRVAGRLRSELIGWLTTVAPDGMPQTSPVWFFWDGSEFLVYSLESTRVRNIEQRPPVSLHLDGDGRGGAIVVVEGIARIDRSHRPASEHEAYVNKYRELMDGYGWSPEYFAERYPVPIRITPTRYRHW